MIMEDVGSKTGLVISGLPDQEVLNFAANGLQDKVTCLEDEVA